MEVIPRPEKQLPNNLGDYLPSKARPLGGERRRWRCNVAGRWDERGSWVRAKLLRPCTRRRWTLDVGATWRPLGRGRKKDLLGGRGRGWGAGVGGGRRRWGGGEGQVMTTQRLSGIAACRPEATGTSVVLLYIDHAIGMLKGSLSLLPSPSLSLCNSFAASVSL